MFCTFFFALLYCFFTFSLALFLALSLGLSLSHSFSLSVCLCLVSFFRPHTRKSANRLIPTGGPGRRSSGQDKVAHAPDVDVDSGVDAASQPKPTLTLTQTQTSTSSSLDWQTTKRARRSRIFVAPLRSQYANVTVCHGVSMRWAPPAESPLSLSLFPALHLSLSLFDWFLALALGLGWRLFNVCLLCLKRQYTVRI